MSTYTRKGHIHGNFNRNRFTKYDGVGRSNTAKFWVQQGWEIKDYDKDEGSDDVQFDRTDQIATKGKKTVYVESAIKSPRLWKFAVDGVDVETRKLKYVKLGEVSYVDMSTDEGDQHMLIPMKCLQMAQDDCGSSFYGQGTISTADFEMPEHGCHRVRKRCRQGYEQTGELEDFYRIPYKYVAHYKMVDDKMKMVHKPEKDVYNER